MGGEAWAARAWRFRRALGLERADTHVVLVRSPSPLACRATLYLFWPLSCWCALQFQTVFETLISTYANDKLLRGQFSFSGKVTLYAGDGTCNHHHHHQLATRLPIMGILALID